MKYFKLALLPLVLLLALTACAHKGSASAAASSASAGAHAVATSSAGVVGREIVNKCVPQSGLPELRWIRYMAAGKNSKDALQGTQTREAFAACAGIPHSKIPAFENAALTDAQNAVKSAATSKQVTLKSAAKHYLGYTLPALVVQYRG